MALPGETTETDDGSRDESPGVVGQKIWLYGPFMRYWGALTTLCWAVMGVMSFLRYPVSFSFVGDLSLGSISICMALWMYALELSYWNSVTIESDGRLTVRWQTIVSSHHCRFSKFKIARSDLISKNVGLKDRWLAMDLEIESGDDDALSSSTPAKCFYLYDFKGREFPIRSWHRKLPAQSCALKRIWQSVPVELRLEREAKPGVPSLRSLRRCLERTQPDLKDLRFCVDIGGGILFLNWLLTVVGSLYN